MWTPCRVMHVLYVLSCTYAKQRGVRRSHFELRTNVVLAFFSMFLFCGWVHWHLLCWGGVKHQAVQRCGGVVWFV